MSETKDTACSSARQGIAAVQPPSVSLPKGGGAIRGIGEKFTANTATGTGSMTVPIATSPGRAGFGPQLALSYDSGAGNGPFGFGWRLVLPSVTRSTDKGLPQYRDAEESDVFVLSGSEDLVPVLIEGPEGSWRRDANARTVEGLDYRVERYRPRVEGLFARLERWTQLATGESHWRSISRDNVTTLYGKTSNSRIADPADPTRVFNWLVCESYDDQGNAVVYEYVPEDSTGVDVAQVHEASRSGSDRSANRYLKRIRYGNAVSRLVQPDLSQAHWFFEVVFDYGSKLIDNREHGQHGTVFPPDGEGRVFAEASTRALRAWEARSDPFSAYRSGFEVRTYRLCRQVLMFHHFPDELGVEDYLVRSTEFQYQQSPVASFLTRVTQSGYLRYPDGRYLKKSLPPVEFEYSRATVDDAVHVVGPESLAGLPEGLDSSRYQWVDLDGEGISGVLTEQADGWFYKRNLSPLNVTRRNGVDRPAACLAPLELVASKPALRLGAERAQFLDLAGDGQLDLVMLEGPAPGLYERTAEGEWSPFRPFASKPAFDPRDPNLRFVDLDGDGHADALLTEIDAFTWYRSLGEEGFAAAQSVWKALDEERGPRLVFADGTQSVFLADMSGDGLSDLVRIRNGEVCYWPNLGYGRFGARVSMDDPPWLDAPDHFDPRRIRLADIDGSGNTDILYLGSDGARLYFNQSGNRWSAATVLASFPRIDNVASVTAVDLLGNGTTCLVWSSPLPGDAGGPMRYVDLMGGQKPHLLVTVRNNLGAETQVRYAPSTRFYLADKQAGRPWITRLPFPVQVVERVETYDRVSRSRFVTRYAYHHGHFDGVEREFRGFGLVEQWDTEEFATLSTSDDFPSGDNVAETSHVPPVLTRTWFHTGAYVEGERIARLFEAEYYREPGLSDAAFEARLLPDTSLPAGLSAEEAREACRALKGSALREEVYGLDRSAKSGHPYRVTERDHTLVLVQPRGSNRHAVFFVHPHETIDYHYERNPDDPRVAHSLTLEVDTYGNVLKSASVGYGRRGADADLIAADRAEQTQTRITCTENAFTNAVSEPDAHRTPLPSESRTYELTGLTLPIGRVRFSFSQVLEAGAAATPIAYEQTPSLDLLEKRTIEHVRTLYRRNSLVGPLLEGQLQSLALPYESYKLALTPGLVADVFGGRVTDAMLATEGRYVHVGGDTGWWIPSGQVFYAPLGEDEAAYARQHFFLSRRYRDPFHTDAVPTETRVRYDAYDLLLEETQDALGNRFTAGERGVDPEASLLAPGNDYRVLQPRLATDPNGNRSEVAFDALGLVVGTAVMGKRGQKAGDSLIGFEPDLADAVIQAHLADPLVDPHAILKSATTCLVYDLHAYARTQDGPSPAPAVVCTLARETHDADLTPGGKTKVQHALAYSDGFGREIQRKILAEPGPLADGGPDVSPRWAASGWTIFNNKGKPIRQYEPFFDDTHAFRFGRTVGVSPILLYDPVERVVATLHPNHTYEKVVFDPWRQVTWDVNDTVTQADPRDDPDVAGFFGRLSTESFLPTWHALRTGPAHAGAAARRWADTETCKAERDAAEKAAQQADTPTRAYFDALGRPFLTVAHNRYRRHDAAPGDSPEDELYQTRTCLDIEGNQRAVIDARGRVVMRYEYDLLGNRIQQASMEAGTRWMLNDVAGKPIRRWDGRGHTFRTEYDELRRPARMFVQGDDPTDPGREILFERIAYGESPDTGLTEQQVLDGNLRTRVYEHRDGAGVVTSDGYDFKGNLLRSKRKLAAEYRTAPDWSAGRALEPEEFAARTRFDALNRVIQQVVPHSDRPGTKLNVIQPRYNEAGLLEGLDAWLRQDAEPLARLDSDTASLHAVVDIDYNAKGQRTRIEYGNRVVTTYAYDSETFRLAHLFTARPRATFPGDDPNPPHPPQGVQNLHYTYDPAGNITRLRDLAQPTVFFRNQVVEATNDYLYDAVSRLIAAAGREHLGQNGNGQPLPPVPTSPDDLPRVGRLHPSDGQAMGRYLEQYVYNQVGNFLKLVHGSTDPAHDGWTRVYEYQEPSLLEPGKTSNRLSRTRVGAAVESYDHDAHGNLTGMPHLPLMRWDYRDQLQATAQQVVNNGGRPETTWYFYDASGQRVRKITDRQAAAGHTPRRRKERVYLGGFELYREYAADGSTLDLERETLHVMDDQQRIALVETKTIEDGQRLQDPEPLQRYQFGNHLGSAVLELDHQSQIISYEEYYPYGSTSYQAVRSQTETAKRYRYTGKERDEESGFYYHGARYYAPWLGRWARCDPAGVDVSPNLYVAFRDSPSVYVDPSGRQEFKPAGSGWHHGRGVAINVDEPSAVGQPGISAQESMRRAADLSNRQFLDPMTNQATKGAFVERPIVPRNPLPPTSVAENPGALISRPSLGGIAEWDELAAHILKKYGSQLEGKSPAQVKNILNRAILKELKNPTTTPGKIISEALEAQLGKPARDLFKSSGTILKWGKAPALLKTAGAGAANAIAIAGALLGGVQIGGGINKITEGKTAMGAVDIAQGSTNVGLVIGTAAGVKSGAIVVKGGVVAGGAAVGAGLLAVGGLALGFEETRRAIRGEKTAAVEATESWADLVVQGEKQGGFKGFLKQAGGWTGGFFSTLIAVGQGY